MSFRILITRALDSLADFREYDRFQELAFQLAKLKWPGLHLTRKFNDRGADAVDNEASIVLACGWNGDLTKLKEDCTAIKKERPKIDSVVFATSRAIDERQVKNWKIAIKNEFGLLLREVIHRDWIIGDLMRPENGWIAYRYLDIPIGDFADLTIYLPRISEAAIRLIRAWKSHYRFEQQPLLDLRIESLGAGLDQTANLRCSDLAGIVQAGSVLFLIGQPGSGKTLSLISIAENMAANGRFKPILVSLRRWANRSVGLIDFVAREAAFQQQGIQASTLATAVEAGKIVFLLNGWNEVSDSQRDFLETELASLRSQFRATTYLITGRARPGLFMSSKPDVLMLSALSDSEIVSNSHKSPR